MMKDRKMKVMRSIGMSKANLRVKSTNWGEVELCLPRLSSEYEL